MRIASRSLLIAVAAALTPAGLVADELDLAAAPGPWAAPLAVEANLRIAGEVIAEGAKAATPVAARIELAYTQQGLDATAGRFVRRVTRAESSAGDNLLRDEARLLVAEPRPLGARVAAVGGPLTRAELDTVQLAADPLDIDGLLPVAPTRDGGTWRVEPDVIGRLLRMRPDSWCEVAGIVGDVTPTHARLRYAGPVHGVVDGAKVKIDLQGVALYDRKAGRIVRLNLAWKESRAVGPATPAVEATAKLNLAITPVPEGFEAATLDQAATAAPDTRLLVTIGRDWRLRAERDWFVVAGGREVTTLRRVEGDRLAAVTTLATRTRSMLSPDELESEVRHALGSDLSAVLRTQQAELDPAVHRTTVASVGAVDGRPVEWRHDHLATPDRAIAATTTLPVEEGEADDAATRRLIDSLRPLARDGQTAAAQAAAVRR